MRASVTVRFCGTLLDVRHVEDGYRIGTAPGVDLPLDADVTEFPIVSRDAKGFVVRRPIGIGTLSCGGDEVRLDEPITFELDHVTIEIARTEVQAPLVKPPFDRRPMYYLAAALLAHLCVWAAAITFAHLPPPKKPRPPLIAKIGATTKAVTTIVPIDHSYTLTAGSVSKVITDSSDAGHNPTAAPIPNTAHGEVSTGISAESGFGAFPPAFLEGLRKTDQAIRDGLAAAGPLYNDYEVETFGGQRSQFDPGKKAGWGTIATGRFKTISTGRGAGDDYRMRGEVRAGDPPENFALCESPKCEIEGALAKADIQRAIDPQALALANCVGDAALTIDFDIAPNGHVKRAHAHGKIGRCAANVIGQLAFPEAEGPTHATYTLGYP